jgi:G3E family GTPase
MSSVILVILRVSCSQSQLCSIDDVIPAKSINVSTAENNPGEGSEEFLELANGCLCCSVKNSGAAAIEKLMEKKGAFDYILLEATGLADPGKSDNAGDGTVPSVIFSNSGPIASMFWQNEEYSGGLGTQIRLDSVICVVDSVFGMKVKHNHPSRQATQTISQQIEEDKAGEGVGESLRYGLPYITHTQAGSSLI